MSLLPSFSRRYLRLLPQLKDGLCGAHEIRLIAFSYPIHLLGDRGKRLIVILSGLHPEIVLDKPRILLEELMHHKLRILLIKGLADHLHVLDVILLIARNHAWSIDEEEMGGVH